MKLTYSRQRLQAHPRRRQPALAADRGARPGKRSAFAPEEVPPRARRLRIATQNIIGQFYHMSVVAIYREWARQKKVLPKERVVKLTATLIENGLNKVLKNS